MQSIQGEQLVVFWCLDKGEYSISCCFKNCEDGVLWEFTGVYGLVCRSKIEDFWEELGVIRGL